METKITLESVDKKIDSGLAALDKKIDGLDTKVEIYRRAIVERFDSIDARFDALESKIDTRFDEVVTTLQRGFMEMKQNPYSDLLNE